LISSGADVILLGGKNKVKFWCTSWKIFIIPTKL